jgi:hypothetical protein
MLKRDKTSNVLTMLALCQSITCCLLLVIKFPAITGGVLIHFDNEFLLCYEKCIDDIYESALKWAYEAESEDNIPIDEIKAAIAKASVSLDFETFMKHFYLWKELTRDKNLPLPSCEWILPMQDAFGNVTKHGLDVKTQACQSMSATIPHQSPGYFDPRFLC